MNNWLLLSTNGKANTNGKGAATCVNALNEAGILALLHEPTEVRSAHERPDRMGLQHVQAKNCRLAVCPGGMALDPGFCQLWPWSLELERLNVRTVCPAASGLKPERIMRGSVFGSGPIAVSVSDTLTQRTVFDTLGVRPQFVGHPALVPGVLCPGHPRDEAIVISLHPSLREVQVEWYATLLNRTGRPVRILVHEEKDWSHAGRIASYAPWSQLINVADVHSVKQWAQVLCGHAFLGANEAEAIGAAALQVPSALVFPSAQHELKLDYSAAGLLQLSQGVMRDGNQMLDPAVVLDALTTIPYSEAQAHVQSLVDWLQAAQLPVRPVQIEPAPQS